MKQGSAWLGTSLAVLGSGAAYAWYYFTEAVKAPRLYYQPGQLSSQLLALCKTLRQPYRPTPWALNTHLQTVLGYLRLASIHGNYQRQLCQTGDGGTIALDWFDGCDAWDYAPMEAPIFLVLHGINGGSHEGYCKWACAAAMSKGWRAVVLNYRGCNGLQLTSPRGYYATLSGDVRVAIDSLKSRFPAAPICAVGYSLGSIMLTKYVAEADKGVHGWQGGSGLVAAAMISNPVCLAGTARSLSNRWSPKFLYNLALAYKLKEYCKTHEEFITQNTRVDLDAVMEAWTVDQFEDQTLFQSIGFTRDEYHRQTSSQYHIPAIRTPSLFLVSEDDPFLGQLPIAECSSNPYTLLAVTGVGGHVAFLKGVWPFKLSWMDEVVVEFMESNLHLHGSRDMTSAQTRSLLALLDSDDHTPMDDNTHPDEDDQRALAGDVGGREEADDAVDGVMRNEGDAADRLVRNQGNAADGGDRGAVCGVNGMETNQVNGVDGVVGNPVNGVVGNQGNARNGGDRSTFHGAEGIEPTGVNGVMRKQASGVDGVMRDQAKRITHSRL